MPLLPTLEHDRRRRRLKNTGTQMNEEARRLSRSQKTSADKSTASVSGIRANGMSRYGID